MKHLRYWRTQENRCMSWPDLLHFYTFYTVMSGASRGLASSLESITC